MRTFLVVAASVVVIACGSKSPPPTTTGTSGGTTEPATPPFTVELVDASAGDPSVDGVIRDKTTEEPLIGATVVFTSPALAGEQIALTDESGRFTIGGLPAGKYAMTVYYSDVSASHDFDLVAGKQARIALAFEIKQQAGDVIVATPIEFPNAMKALEAGSMADAFRMGKQELARKASSKLHGLLAIATWGSAVQMVQMRNPGEPDDDDMNTGVLRKRVVKLLADLDAVQGHLAEAAKDPGFALELCIACMATESGHLPIPPGSLDVERDPSGQELPEGDPRRRPTYRFDHGDLLWARAMVSYQQALVNVALAYDWTWFDALVKDDNSADDTKKEEPKTVTIKLIEPARIATARDLLLAGLSASTETRAAFLAETDDDREWVPNPKQKNFASPLRVDAKLYQTWEDVIGDIRSLVAGETGLSFEAIARVFGARKGDAPKGYMDLGAMLSAPKDIVWDLGALDRIEREKNKKKRNQMTTKLLQQILGNGYKTRMKPSPLTDRLIQIRKDLDGGAEQAVEDKLKYFFWLN